MATKAKTISAAAAKAAPEGAAVYVVKEPIFHDGARHEPGDEVLLTEEQAEPLLAFNVAPKAKAKAKDESGT